MSWQEVERVIFQSIMVCELHLNKAIFKIHNLSFTKQQIQRVRTHQNVISSYTQMFIFLLLITNKKYVLKCFFLNKTFT